MIELESLYLTFKGNPEVDPVEATAKVRGISNREVLQSISLQDYIEYLIHEKIIPDIDSSAFIDKSFNKDWLDSTGALED